MKINKDLLDIKNTISNSTSDLYSTDFINNNFIKQFKILLSGNLNDIEETSLYYADSDVINKPGDTENGYVITMTIASETIIQIYCSYSGLIFRRSRQGSSHTWSGWVPVSRLTVIYIHAVNSWSQNGACYIAKQNQMVNIQYCLRNGTSTTMGTIPNLEYCPSDTLILPATTTGGESGYVKIDSNGVVECSSNLVGKTVVFNGSYPNLS